MASNDIIDGKIIGKKNPSSQVVIDATLEIYRQFFTKVASTIGISEEQLEVYIQEPFSQDTSELFGRVVDPTNPREVFNLIVDSTRRDREGGSRLISEKFALGLFQEFKELTGRDVRGYLSEPQRDMTDEQFAEAAEQYNSSDTDQTIQQIVDFDENANPETDSIIPVSIVAGTSDIAGVTIERGDVAVQTLESIKNREDANLKLENPVTQIDQLRNPKVLKKKIEQVNSIPLEQERIDRLSDLRETMIGNGVPVSDYNEAEVEALPNKNKALANTVIASTAIGAEVKIENNDTEELKQKAKAIVNSNLDPKNQSKQLQALVDKARIENYSERAVRQAIEPLLSRVTARNESLEDSPEVIIDDSLDEEYILGQEVEISLDELKVHQKNRSKLQEAVIPSAVAGTKIGRAINEVERKYAEKKGSIEIRADIATRGQPVFDTDKKVIDAAEEVLSAFRKNDRGRFVFDRQKFFSPEAASLRKALDLELANYVKSARHKDILEEGIRARLLYEGIEPTAVADTIDHIVNYYSRELTEMERDAQSRKGLEVVDPKTSETSFKSRAALELQTNQHGLQPDEIDRVSTKIASVAVDEINFAKNLSPVINVRTHLDPEGKVIIDYTEKSKTPFGTAERTSTLYAVESNPVRRVSRMFLSKYAQGLSEEELIKTIQDYRAKKASSQYWDNDQEARLRTLEGIAYTYDEGRKLSSFLLSNEFRIASNNPLWYAISAPVRIPFYQFAPNRVKDKYLEMQKKREGPKSLVNYKSSLNVPAIFANVLKQQAMLMTPFYGIDEKNKVYNRLFYWGYTGLDKGFDRLGKFSARSYSLKYDAVGQHIKSGAHIGIREHLSLGWKRRIAENINHRKKKRTPLLGLLAKITLGAAVGSGIEAATNVIRATSTGGKILNSLESFNTGVRSSFNGLNNAWRYGEGWANRGMLTALETEKERMSMSLLDRHQTFNQGSLFKEQLKYGTGRFVRGMNVFKTSAGIIIKSAGKGFIAYGVLSLTGASTPLAIGFGSLYAFHSFVTTIANNPTLGLGIYNNGTTEFIREGAFVSKSRLFKWFSEALYKGPGFASINRSLLQRFVRYLPKNGFLVGSVLSSLGVNPVVAYSVGMIGDVGIKVATDVLASRFALPSQFGMVSRTLGGLLTKVSGITGILGGIVALDEMGGITKLFSAGISLTTGLRLLGIASLLAGGYVFGLPGLAIAGGALVVDTFSHLLFNRSLLSYFTPVWESIAGPTMKALQSAMGLLLGLYKLFTAEDLNGLIEAVISSTIGILAIGGLLAGGMVAATLFTPGIPTVESSQSSYQSEYFKDVTKSLVSSNEVDGKTQLMYKITYTFTGGPEKNMDMIGVNRIDEMFGLNKSLIDKDCSGFVGSYTGFSYLDSEDHPVFADKGQFGLGVFGTGDLREFLHFTESDIDQPVEFEFRICLNDKIGNVKLASQNGSFTNRFLIRGIPVPPTPLGEEFLPDTYSYESASAQDSRNNKLERIAYYDPLSGADNVCITSPFGVQRVINGVSDRHEGLDLAIDSGTAIHPISAGTVEKTGYQDKLAGNYVVINHGNGLFSKYFHMLSTPEVVTGDFVNTNNIIGFVGSTGNSTGPHLHLQINPNGVWSKAVDPCGYIDCSIYKQSCNSKK